VSIKSIAYPNEHLVCVHLIRTRANVIVKGVFV
jgi:hypothetical protein